MKMNKEKTSNITKTKYKTKQREFIIKYFESNQNKHVTAEDIIEYCKEEKIAISKATIYRTLNLLLEESIINKYFIDEKACSCYMLTTTSCNSKDHYHLRCKNCDKIFHIDGLEFEKISKKIKKEFNFTIDVSKTTLYGKCGDCFKETKGEKQCL